MHRPFAGAIQSPVEEGFRCGTVSASQADSRQGIRQGADLHTNDFGTFKRAVDMTDDELAAI